MCYIPINLHPHIHNSPALVLTIWSIIGKDLGALATCNWPTWSCCVNYCDCGRIMTTRTTTPRDTPNYYSTDFWLAVLLIPISIVGLIRCSRLAYSSNVRVQERTSLPCQNIRKTPMKTLRSVSFVFVCVCIARDSSVNKARLMG